jgi:hypothetical protein
MKKERVLLPSNIKPKLHKLCLEPDLKNCTFKGSQEVQFELKEKTKM